MDFTDRAAVPQAPELAGYLTESIQSRAAIVLADVFQRGVTLDLEQAKTTQRLIQQRIDDQVIALNEVAPDVFARTNKGEYRITNEQARVPTMREAPIRKRLREFCTSAGITNPPLTDKNHEISLSVKYWRQFHDKDTFIKH